jgi:hypothetical protein
LGLVIQEAIYQVRWVDAFGKDGNIATDAAIAEAVVKVLEREQVIDGV